MVPCHCTTDSVGSFQLAECAWMLVKRRGPLSSQIHTSANSVGVATTIALTWPEASWLNWLTT